MPDSSPSRRLIVIRMRVFGPKVWLTILEWFVQNNEEDWWRLTRDPRPTRVLLQIFQSRIKMQTEKKLWSTLQTDLISSLNTRRSSHRNNKKSLLKQWMWEVWWFSSVRIECQVIIDRTGNEGWRPRCESSCPDQDLCSVRSVNICEKFCKIVADDVMLTPVTQSHVDHPQLRHDNIPPLLLGAPATPHSHQGDCHNIRSRTPPW